MAQRITGTGRVIVAPITVQWRTGQCLVAYAREGEMAIVATVPAPEVPHGESSLWDVAARHLPTNVVDQNESYGRWIMNVGWGMSVMPPKRALFTSDEPWTVDVMKTARLKAPAYNSVGVHVGRLTFDDPQSMARARALLAPGNQ
ncbi:hypothetical protein [Streptomyces buecherae]|uniref:hypothetical protein n=1 Tax=Streptomyces buecherae TaxID=2763006 RepID=UPI0037B320AA